MSDFQRGDRVHAAHEPCNGAREETGGSAIPGISADTHIATAGPRGVVANVGHAEADLYLARLHSGEGDAVSEPAGCLVEELRNGEQRRLRHPSF